nr:hypothetical protein [Tanacetum cinerariifolium]
MTASVPYVREKGVSPWLDLTIVLWAQRTWGSSSTQFLFPSPKCALMPSPRLLFALSTSPLDCGCLANAKCCVILNLSHQSLNGLSANCLPLSEIISLGIPKRHTMLSHTNFFTCSPVNSIPSGFVNMSLAPDPSTHDKPSVNNVHGSSWVSATDVLCRALLGISLRKSASIWPLIDVLGL